MKKKVLLAVDGSDYTKRMLAFLAAHDDLLAGEVHYAALTVIPRIPPHAARFFSEADLATYYGDEAGKVLAPVQAFMQQKGWASEVKHRCGHAGDEVAAEADSGKYDLVVLGSHGHGAVGSLVLGSVAARVLAKCGVPVLLVR